MRSLSLIIVGALSSSAFAVDGSLLSGSAFSSTPFSGASASDAFDGDTGTNFAGNGPDGGYVGQTFAVAKRVKGFRYFPQAGYESRSNGAVFQVYRVSDSSWVTVYTVLATPSAGWQEFSVVADFDVSAWRYVSANGSWCGIAELEAWGTDKPASVEEEVARIRFLAHVCAFALCWQCGLQFLHWIWYVKNQRDFY